MKMLITILFISKLLLSVKAVDKCGDRCTSSQVCFDDGTCVSRSDTVTCGFGYCRKGQDCCGYMYCMPAGEVCCNNGPVYCKRDHTCCGSILCCLPGYVCQNRKCVVDIFSSTQTPSKYTTSKATRATKLITRSPTPKTTKEPTARSFQKSTSSSFQWWFGVIIAVVVLSAVITTGIVVRKRIHSGPNAYGRSGNGGMVIQGPVQTSHRQPQRNNRHIRTIQQMPNKNMVYAITKGDVPMQIIRQPSQSL